MADWKRNLRRASFRFVPFYVDDYSGEHGRRWADHEYPGRDMPYAEDLGRSQRVWRFSGYLVGDNYAFQRDMLVMACEMPGPGELVHPTIGAVRAVCRTITHDEQRNLGRFVTLQFEFAEAGQLTAPGSFMNLVSQIASYALPLGNIAGASFQSGFDTSRGGAWLTRSAEGQIVQLSADLARVRHPAPGLDQAPLNRALATLVQDAPALATNPPALRGACDTTFHAYTDAGEAAPVVRSMLLYASPAAAADLPLMLVQQQQADDRAMVGGSAVYSLPIIVRQRRNAIAFETYTRILALREIGYALPGIALDNYDEAITLLDAVAQAFIEIEGEVADVGDDDTYNALINLRTALTQLIRDRAASLTPLIRYRIIGTPANSLTLAWRMYQDSGRNLEIVARTKARNPGYLPHTGRVLAA
jgi:hypothetical protein